MAAGLADIDTAVRPYYADDYYQDGHLFRDKIAPELDRSIFAIFDISNAQRASVFLELGYAYGIRLPVILTAQRGVEPPADLAGFDRIVYEGYQALGPLLKDRVNRIVTRDLLLRALEARGTTCLPSM
ncbi:MAG: hypothetical protein WEB00_00540 [Dehalococcoidia bacterium]